MRRHALLLTFCLVLVVAFGPSLQAAPIQSDNPLVPAGLGVGDTFRLAFVTSNTWQDPQTTGGLDIAILNTRVNDAANASGSVLAPLGANWNILGSTLNTNANANTATTGTDTSYPIYNLAGDIVSTGNSALWGSDLDNPISTNEQGQAVSTRVWTGTDSNNGQRRGDWFLGDTGGGWRYFGWSDKTGGGYTDGWASNLGQNWDNTFSYYGLSEPLDITAAAGVPEPGTVALALLGLVGLMFWGRSRKQRA